MFVDIPQRLLFLREGGASVNKVGYINITAISTLVQSVWGSKIKCFPIINEHYQVVKGESNSGSKKYYC